MKEEIKTKLTLFDPPINIHGHLFEVGRETTATDKNGFSQVIERMPLALTKADILAQQQSVIDEAQSIIDEVNAL